jgi:hypothetical protein
MGSTFIYVIGNILLGFLIIISSLMKLDKLSLWLKEQFVWNYFIRFMMQQYFTLYLSSVIQMQSLKNEDGFLGDKVG